MTDTRYRIHAASLVYFDAVRRAGSIREAARRLNVASSAVNRQILALEAELETPLFKRLPNGLRLTSAGEILANHVTGVLRDAERLQSELDALKGLDAGHVELVTLEGLCHHIVPSAIAAMSERHPRVSIGVSIMGSGEIPRAIAHGDADLGLAFEVPTQPELQRKEAVAFRLGAVVLPTSPLASAPHVTLPELRAEKLIVPKDNFANRVQLNPAMLHAELSRAGRYEAGSIDLMKQLVLRGLGIALMTQVGLEAEIASGNLVHVPLRHGKGFFPSALGLYARSGTALSLAAEAFAQHLAKAMVDAAGNEQAAS